MYYALIVSDSKKTALELESSLKLASFNFNKVYSIVKTTLLDSMIKTFNPHLIIIDQKFTLNNNLNTKTITYTKPLDLISIKHSISEVFSQNITSDNTTVLFELIKNFINENFANPELSTSLVSYSLKISSGQICKIFKTNTNDTLTNYIKSVRIKKAMELFLDSTLSVEDISLLVGYKDRRYFTKIFKSIAGSSPSSYRENL